MWKLLLLVFCTQNWCDTRHSQLWHRVVWQIRTESTCYLHHQGDGGGRFLSDDVTYLLVYSGWTKVRSNIIITTLRTSDLILYDTQQVFEISAKIWLIWDCNLRYLIVVWGHAVVWLSGCVWTSQKVSSACSWDLSFSVQWNVCHAGMCSLIDMYQDCNWAQGNQTWLTLALLHKKATPFWVHLYPILFTLYHINL